MLQHEMSLNSMFHELSIAFVLHSQFSFNRSNITWEKAEELKIEHCYVAQDFASELQQFQVEYLLFLTFFYQLTFNVCL